ncbi:MULTISPECIES: sensor histidine kinase [unclassified Colwellia]|jgi:nitrogen fixation/metabolism regulation signal transduction histidine kinase|uniref:sensor histidine kinase n=1 Tax=unclassified Colwellia TaxID=196834 RepID=UPI0015F64BAE|nr:MULTISPECIES: ATP-binding protein [unclassified Colwellia]MBA6233207.1 GHKL domain-containing protein [Colwellia sp. MB02u-7]MBA6236297.1 GHKL domain-containing protein [Colwellia sp. MB02u-11]MBA6256004.1 GHKL domain-containing protein [Colwellia sp. MB3u-28]MBA6259173.1 GHKL domain-containing protein [Colwellia sp. MB3u-41]MBA6298303.1 GHKL domain-containing protein [Colwellia sp. MB3u-22]
MDFLNSRPTILMVVNLVALLACISLLTRVYNTIGMSSTLLLVLVLAISLTVSLMTCFKRQDQQIIQVVRALANGDNTLGFGDHHPMRQHFEGVKSQMQSARFVAERQSEFLQALLVHINLAVIVCDSEGSIIESNPAVAKLLGKSVNHLDELNHIGTIVFSTQENLQSTVQWKHGEQEDTLTVQVSIAEIHGQKRKIITLQSIHELLLNKEQQAYKRLTHVLTHEVANTITPLASIAQTCLGLIPKKLSFIDEENKQDFTFALNTLASRTLYLGEFIASFRQISNLPMPNLLPTQLATILARIEMLHRKQLHEYNTNLTTHIQNQQLVMLDSAQIEQVLINLIKNAIEAVKSYSDQQISKGGSDNVQNQISLTVALNKKQQLYIEVADNGAGIDEHAIEMVFVPFYTTKRQGSGIGLSLSRQIMTNHGGDLVYLPRDKGACFRCIFG